MKKITIGILTLSLALIGFTNSVFADANNEVCEKNPTATICQQDCFKNPNADGCDSSIKTPINEGVSTFIIVIGIIAAAMIVWSGIRMTAFHNNDTKSWGKARNILLASVIALVISALALVIVNIVIGATNELTVTIPEIIKLS